MSNFFVHDAVEVELLLQPERGRLVALVDNVKSSGGAFLFFQMADDVVNKNKDAKAKKDDNS